MPLPGGPSDKLGNRYELRWIARRFVDLLTGRLQWLRIEPPGEDAIEFRCGSNAGEEAHQVKRGLSGGGHWTIAALQDVIDDFGVILTSDPSIHCEFVSEYAAAELNELTNRARAARDIEEFLSRFLDAKWVFNAWKQVQKRWGTDDAETWSRLRHITVTTVSEEHLRDNMDTILQLFFDAPPESARAALTELALESIHRALSAQDVLEWLSKRGIRKFASGSAHTIARTMSAPPAMGIRRAIELQGIADLLATGRATVFIGGISGIGKTTVASQFAAEWKAPVCWVDCGLIASGIEALGAIGQFLADTLRNNAVGIAVAKETANPAAVARLAGKHLAAAGCLLVWDGVEGDLQNFLRPTINAISSTILGGAQLVTAQVYYEPTLAGSQGSVHVDRLDRVAIRRLLVNAYPEARVPELEAAEELTRGHPYLVQLLTGTAQNVDLATAIAINQTSERSDPLTSQLLSRIPETTRSLLSTLVWLEIPFSAAHVARLGGTAESLKELASRYLVLRSGAGTYRTHDIVANVIKQATTEAERVEIHEKIALFLRGLAEPSWLEVRAMLRHALAADMLDVAREAGHALLVFAMTRVFWSLAREAAESLLHSSAGVAQWFAHFTLGKWNRMAEDFETALVHYVAAEECAFYPKELEMARYERASVLCELGRREEADPLYIELAKSSDAGTRVEATIALALGLGLVERGDVPAAMAMLEEASVAASKAGMNRAVAEVQQAAGMILAKAERWEEALAHLKKAYSVRYALDGDSPDVYGWYHLYEHLFLVESVLGNKDGARRASHGLWRFSVLSGSPRWEARSASAMCLADPNEQDPEVIAALSRLRAASDDSSNSPTIRLAALESLVLCEWTLHHYEKAIEATLEIVAIGQEFRLPVPIFAHRANNDGDEDNVVGMPGGWGLLMPQGKGEEFLLETASEIFDRRPELAQYANLIRAVPENANAHGGDSSEED